VAASHGSLPGFLGDVCVGPAAALGLSEGRGVGPEVLPASRRQSARLVIRAEGADFAAAWSEEGGRAETEEVAKRYREAFAMIRAADLRPGIQSVCLAVLPAPAPEGCRSYAEVAVQSCLDLATQGLAELRQVHLVAASAEEAEDLAELVSQVWVARGIAEQEAVASEPTARRSVIALLVGPAPGAEALQMAVLEEAMAAVERTYDDPTRSAAEWTVELEAALVRLTGRSDRLKHALIAGHGWVRGSSFRWPPDRPRLLADLSREVQRCAPGAGSRKKPGGQTRPQKSTTWSRWFRCLAPRPAEDPGLADPGDIDDDSAADPRAILQQVSEAWDEERAGMQQLYGKLARDVQAALAEHTKASAQQNGEVSVSLQSVSRALDDVNNACRQQPVTRPSWVSDLFAELREGRGGMPPAQEVPPWARDLAERQAQLCGRELQQQLAEVASIRGDLPEVLDRCLAGRLPEMLSHSLPPDSGRTCGQPGCGDDSEQGKKLDMFAEQVTNQAKRLKRLSQRMGDLTMDHETASADIVQRIEDLFDLVGQLQLRRGKPKGSKAGRKSRPPEETGNISGSQQGSVRAASEEDHDHGGYVSPGFGRASDSDDVGKWEGGMRFMGDSPVAPGKKKSKRRHKGHSLASSL